MSTIADAFRLEARRLAAAADDAEERLSNLVHRAEAASDIGAPMPAPDEMARARKRAHAARAAADTAARLARQEERLVPRYSA